MLSLRNALRRRVTGRNIRLAVDWGKYGPPETAYVVASGHKVAATTELSVAAGEYSGTIKHNFEALVELNLIFARKISFICSICMI